VKGMLEKFLVVALLAGITVVAYGASFHGWFLPRPLEKPVSLREGSVRGGTHGHGFIYFMGGRSHYGGGYRRGK